MSSRQDDGHRVRRLFAATLTGLLAVGAAACTAPPETVTTPTTTTTAAPTTVAAVITAVFGVLAPEATKIARCESGLRPTAVSPTDDHGLFQINAVHKANFTTVTGQPWSEIYNPMMNTRYAKWLYDRQGWAPWACRSVLAP
jgi:hypothetical protein